jgi:hypothetical protein
MIVGMDAAPSAVRSTLRRPPRKQANASKRMKPNTIATRGVIGVLFA